MQQRTMPQILKSIRATLRDAGIYKKHNKLCIIEQNKQQDHLLEVFLKDFIKDPTITIRRGEPKDDTPLSSAYLEQSTQEFIESILTNTDQEKETLRPFGYVNAEELERIAKHYDLPFTPNHDQNNLVEAVEQFARGSKRATIKSIEKLRKVIK